MCSYIEYPVYIYNYIKTVFIRDFLYAGFFLGGNPELKDEASIYTTQDRQNLRTQAMGNIELRLNIILRNFDKFGVEVG